MSVVVPAPRHDLLARRDRGPRAGAAQCASAGDQSGRRAGIGEVQARGAGGTAIAAARPDRASPGRSPWSVALGLVLVRHDGNDRRYSIDASGRDRCVPTRESPVGSDACWRTPKRA